MAIVRGSDRCINSISNKSISTMVDVSAAVATSSWRVISGQAKARPCCHTQNGPHDAIIRLCLMVASIIYTVSLKNNIQTNTEGNGMKTLGPWRKRETSTNKSRGNVENLFT